MSAPDTLTTALSYAERGWHVFPLRPDTKRAATPGHRAADCLPGGYGGPTGTDAWCRTGHAGWEERATTRRDWIRRAWSAHPDRGVGIAAGPSRLVVVDLDTLKPGEEIPEPWHRFGATCGRDVLEMLATAKAGSIVPTWTVRTISGGEHLYYRAPEGVRFANTAGTLGALVDTRARGGYVVAPPTTIAGAGYELVDDRPAAPLPAWLADALAERNRPGRGHPGGGSTGPARPMRHPNGYLTAALNAEAAKVRHALPGQHNHTLFCAAVALGQLVAGGALAEHDAHDALADAAGVLMARGCRCTPSEVDSTIRSGFATGARNPRTPNNARSNSRSNSRKAA